jgi:hypothetical protein
MRLTLKPLIEPGRSGAPLKVMFWVLIIGLLAGCAQISGEPALTPPAASTSPTAQQPTHTATAVPPKVLNVCLAEDRKASTATTTSGGGGTAFSRHCMTALLSC